MEPTTKQLALAQRVNVKWRKWAKASDKASAPYPSDADRQRSVRYLNEFSAFMRTNDIHDYCDGEHFALVLADGSTLCFHFSLKGDPRFVCYEPNLEVYTD